MIDAHKHLGVHFGGGWANKSVAELTGRLDDAYVDVYVDLDGGWSEDILEARLRKFKEVAPVRFIFFGGPGWKHWQVDGDRFGENAGNCGLSVVLIIFYSLFALWLWFSSCIATLDCQQRRKWEKKKRYSNHSTRTESRERKTNPYNIIQNTETELTERLLE